LFAAVNRDHPLARIFTLRLRTLGAEDLISLPKGTGLAAALAEVCAAAHLTPRTAFEAASAPVLPQLPAHGPGLAVRSESAHRALPDDLPAMPIVRPRLTGRIALAWRTDGPRSPAARALMTRARHHLSPLP